MVLMPFPFLLLADGQGDVVVSPCPIVILPMRLLEGVAERCGRRSVFYATLNLREITVLM